MNNIKIRQLTRGQVDWKFENSDKSEISEISEIAVKDSFTATATAVSK